MPAWQVEGTSCVHVWASKHHVSIDSVPTEGDLVLDTEFAPYAVVDHDLIERVVRRLSSCTGPQRAGRRPRARPALARGPPVALSRRGACEELFGELSAGLVRPTEEPGEARHLGGPS